jgi:cytohesin
MLLKHAVAVVTVLSPIVLLAQAPGAPSGPAQPPGIHDLALKGDLEAVTALLAADPGLLEAEKPPNKKTPLHYAAQGGHAALVGLLLDRGAQINRPNIIGETALHYAAAAKHPETAALLAARGASLTARTERGATPLRLAVAFDRVPNMKLLLERGSDAREVDRGGETLLHIAASLGSPEGIALLIAAGVDVNAAKPDGETPLLSACTAGQVANAQALLKAGADPNTRDALGREPLALAVRSGRQDFVKSLLDAGADATRKPAARARGPLHLAAALGYGGIADLLLAKGAGRDVRDGQGQTAVELAMAHGNVLLARKLAGAAAAATTRAPALPAPSPLTRRPARGESIVWYLGHMGWAVRTANHLLIFDCDGRVTVPPDEPSIANGWIVPSEIGDVPTTVFVTHGHVDHYAPAIFDWKARLKNVAIVTGFEPKGKTGYVFIGPRESGTTGDLEITTIKAMDEGVGFHVKVDGVSIFHSGDHDAAWEMPTFKPEIDFLAGRGLRADILFMPVQLADIPILDDGLGYAIRSLSAGAFFPGHARGREHIYLEVAAALKKAGIETPVYCAEFGGDRFTVRPRAGSHLPR